MTVVRLPPAAYYTKKGACARLQPYLEQVKVQQPVPVLGLGYLEYAVHVVVRVLAYVVRPERAAEVVAVELGHLALRALGPVPQYDPLGRRLVQVGRGPRGVRLDGRVVRGGGQQPDAGVERLLRLLRPAHGDHHPVLRVLQLRDGRGQRRLGQVGPVDGQQPVAHVYRARPVGQSTCATTSVLKDCNYCSVMLTIRVQGDFFFFGRKNA